MRRHVDGEGTLKGFLLDWLRAAVSMDDLVRRTPGTGADPGGFRVEQYAKLTSLAPDQPGVARRPLGIDLVLAAGGPGGVGTPLR